MTTSSSRLLGRPTLVVLFLVVTLVYGMSPVAQNGDAYLYPATAWTMVHDRTLALESFHGIEELDNHYGVGNTPSGAHVNRYPWVPALLFVPAIIVVDVVQQLGIGRGSRALIADGTRSNGLLQLAIAAPVTALVSVLIALIAFERLTGEVRRRRRLALLVAFGFAFGTSAWSTVSRALWQHGPGLVVAATAVLLAQRLARRQRGGHRTAAALGAVVAIAYTARPTHALTVVAFSTWVLWQHRQQAVAYFAGAGSVALPWLTVNQQTWKAPLPPYFSGDRIGLQPGYLEGLGGVLVSPSRGLLVFCPIVLLAAARLWRSRIRTPMDLGPLDVVLSVTFAVSIVLLAALAREAWWGGHSYGPRLLSDMLVYVAVLAVPTIDHLEARCRARKLAGRRMPAAAALAVVALTWSVVINAQGAISRSTACWNVRPDDIDEHPDRLWSWTDPQFLAAPQRLWSTKSVVAATLADDCT